MAESTPDVIVVGAGVIGLGIADALARRGVAVTLLERERVGARASWAGAGMINCRPRLKSKKGETDYSDLILASVKMYESWTARLLEETGIDAGFRRCEALEICPHQGERDKDLDAIVAGCAARGVKAERITAAEARALEPALAAEQIAAAVHLPEDGQVRSPRLTRALALACRQRGARIKEGVAVAEIWIENGKVRGVVAGDGARLAGSNVVMCTGAWTGQFKALTTAAPVTAKIEPVCGQIVCYQLPAPPCSRLLTVGEHYIVPRPDGVVLIGSTTERTGFDAVITPEGQAELCAFAETMLPILRTVQPVQGWADLRPGMKGRHPVMGPVPGVEGLYVAAGHFRNGLCLAPITAEILTALVLKKQPPLPIEPFLPR